MSRFFAFSLVIALGVGCRAKPSPNSEAAEPAAVPRAEVAVAKTSAAPQRAKLGEAAPEFELSDLEGKRVKLSALRGKTVVLEWFNPECPFVRMSHTKGSLVGTAARHAKAGIVWLAINSAAPGKQGGGAERNRDAKQAFKLEHPILLDESGKVGNAYGAERTPHMFIINPQGILVYRGAIDNSPDGEGESPKDGKLINYVDNALADISAKRAVAIPNTEAYGCTVKYGS